MSTKKVLIPLDGSEFSRQILPVIGRFFPATDNELILLQIATVPGGMVGAPPRSIVAEGWSLPIYESAEALMQAKHPIYSSQELDRVHGELTDAFRPIVRDLEGMGYTVSVAVRFGDPAPEIVEFARSEGIDAIAMATHGRTGISRLVLGSVAEYVLRHVAVPVVLIRPFAEPATVQTSGDVLANRLAQQAPLRVAVATDGTPATQRALAFAGDLARRIPFELTMLVTVDEVTGATWGRDILDATWNAVGEVTPRPQAVPLVGYPDTAILRQLTETPVDLLIVAPFGDRISAEAAAVGPTVQRLGHYAPTSVLTVKGSHPHVQRILACTAIDDEPVVRVAAHVANALDADLRVLHVVPPDAVTYLTYSDTDYIAIDDVLRQATPLSDYAHNIINVLETAGYSPETVMLRRGTVPDAIYREAQEYGCDLIVVGSQSSPGYFLGSVANHIFKYADRSVLVVRMSE